MKGKNIIFFLVFLLFSQTSFTQNYISEIEENALTEYKKDSLNYNFLKSVCAIDSTFSEAKYTEYFDKLDKVVMSLPVKEIKSKKEKKRIKKIYDIIHSQFLRKYEENSIFTDIFKNGNYNCVTASAIYVYVFDRLNIPYHVKEVPSHVYLIAYPKTYNIYLETTVPGAYGFVSPKDSEIKKIVDELTLLKLVSKQEVQNKGYKKIYNDYFYGKEFVSKSSLIGMQYYNKSYYDFESQNYKSAYKNITKSLVYYTSPISKQLNQQLILLNLSELKVKNDDDLEVLFNSLSSLKFKKDFSKDNVKALLYRITEDNDNDFIEKAVEKLSTFEDAELNKLCQEELYDFLASDHAGKQNLDKAIHYSEILLDLKPDNKKAKEIIIFSISKKMYSITASDKALSEIDSYYKKYNFLKGDKRIESGRASLYGQMVEKSFINRQPKKGIKYLDKFENILDTQKENILINPKSVTNLYLMAGRYYFGKSNFKTAKNIFEKGLEYSPDSFELKKMLKWAKEDMR